MRAAAPWRYHCDVLKRLNPTPPPLQDKSPRADWLLFLVLVAIALIAASAFVVGYVLIASAP